MKTSVSFLVAAAMLGWMAGCSGPAPEPDSAMEPVPFSSVKVDDAFWSPRIETNRTVTIPADFRKCEQTGRIRNFEVAGKLARGKFQGIRFNDSDVFKVIEGASYSLVQHPDAKLEAYLDDLIAKIAAAQEEDGYLYTTRTIDPEHPAAGAGKTRWSNLISSHELYNAGHMYEAAVAYYRATGKRAFLDVALKNADLICRTFGPGKLHDIPGHEEIEIGLVKLYRVTGEEKYLQLAKFFLNERGHPERRSPGARSEHPEYTQDHLPVLEQREAVGHAVRAMYLYSGMADVALLTGDEAYVEAIDRIWDNVVSKKMYLTGGVGARHGGESFGDNYELPNATAYAETCAAIGNALWNYRLFLLHGDAKYLDVLERILYNGFLSGVSLKGDTFFYVNPLSADGKTKFNQGSATRKPWFNCACCPTNIVRFMPSIPGYVYARRGGDIYVNLFLGGEARIETANNTVQLVQQTRYPWDGRVDITVNPSRQAGFAILVRIPGWARNRPVPSDLYRYATIRDERVSLRVNGKDTPLRLEAGFARIERVWKKGDVIELRLPMPVRRVLANARVADDAGKVALERGPVVYCVEGIDNGGDLSRVKLNNATKLGTAYRPDLLGGIEVIEGGNLLAIPYYAWSNRGPGPMEVWLPMER